MPHAPTLPPALPDGRIFLTDAQDRTIILPTSWHFTTSGMPGVTPRADTIRHHGAIQTAARRLGIRTGGASGELYSVPSSGEGSVWAIAWPPEPGDWSFGPTAAQLDALLMIVQEIPIHLQIGSLDARTLTLNAIDVTHTEVDGVREQVTLTWEAFDPLWQGEAILASDGSITNGGVRVVMVEGTAPTSPIITITGPIENPVVTNEATGGTFEYFGILAAGQDLVVDTGALTAEANGLGVLGSMSDTFALGFTLVPGVNTLRLVSTSGGANVHVAWRERWY